MPQIDEKTSKKTLYFSLQRYNTRISLDKLADRFRRSRFYSTRLLRSVLILSICYSIAYSVIHFVSFLLPSSFIYPNTVLHSRLVGQSLYITIQSRRIASSRATTVFFRGYPLFWTRCVQIRAFANRLRRLQVFHTCYHR
jgi:hypothetical protein